MAKLSDIDSFGIVVPKNWHILPLDLPTFDRFCAETTARWSQEDGWTRTAERQALLLLQRVRGELTRHGASFAAVYVDAAVPEGKELREENLEPLMAVCTFGVYTRADLDTDLELSLAVLFTAFAKRPSLDGGEYGRITNVEPPALHDLAAGRAVRLRRLYEPKGFGPAAQDPFFGDTFLLPVGEHGEAAGVLQFATTTVSAARPFSDLFGAIANTLRSFTPDDPTDFSERGDDLGG